MPQKRRHAARALWLLGGLIVASCSDRDPAGLDVARAPIDPLVFGDAYGDDVYFQPFFGTHYTAVSVDSVHAYSGQAADGARALKVEIPPIGSALGAYSGGVLTSVSARDLADFNALAFYARADTSLVLNLAGFGNDNTGTSLFESSVANLAIHRNWTQYVVPIPGPSKLIAERGMFLFAEAAEADKPLGYDVWFDDIRFVKLDDIALFRAQITSTTYYIFTGAQLHPGSARSIFTRAGQFVVVDHNAGYFDFTTSDEAVASVDRTGNIRARGQGQATITAQLEGVNVLGTLTVRAFAPPTVAAPEPTLPASQVISMFSDSYPGVPVDTWRADWGGVTTSVADYSVKGNAVKMYSTLNWVGVEFFHPLIDASTMQFLHVDVYAPAGSSFEIKLVSFSADLGSYVESSVFRVDASSTPPFVAASWMSLEIRLSDLTLASGWDWSRIGQLVFASTDAKLVLVDNVYWHP